MALADLLIGGLTEANKTRQENQRLAKQLFIAKQKAQMAQLDAGEILDQIQLKNIVNRLGAFQGQPGQMPQQPGQVQQPQGGQPQAMGQPGQQPSFRPQPVRQPMQQQQLGQPQMTRPIGQPQMTMAPPQFQHQYENIPDGIDKYGVPKYKVEETAGSKLKFKELQTAVTKKAEAVSTRETAVRMQLGTTNLIIGSMSELGDLWANAYKEGGVGSFAKNKIAQFRLKAGGRQAEDLEATAAFPGLKTEVVSRLMPALTQQGDKPGSVRLVETVFRKVELTLPSGETVPKNARRMMAATIRNSYRFARAGRMLGLTNEFVAALPDDQLKMFSTKVANLARNIKIIGKEKQVLDNLINTALSSIDEIIGNQPVRQKGFRGAMQGQFPGFTDTGKSNIAVKGPIGEQKPFKVYGVRKVGD